MCDFIWFLYDFYSFQAEHCFLNIAIFITEFLENISRLIAANIENTSKLRNMF